jgi:phosphate transport system protein
MRDIFHDELDDIGKRVLEMTKLASIAMEKATQALLGANLTLADEVARDDRRIDALSNELEERSFQLIAQQQPVATDLRVLI